MTAEGPKKILIEVMYKASYCLPCVYMDEAVCEVMPKYAQYVDYQRVEFLKGDGKKRFLELSRSLFGEEGVYKHHRIAPVPSLFINGELFFDAIPPKFELEEAIEEVLKGLTMHTQKIHLEVFHEGEHWIPCVYMTRVVEAVAPEFKKNLTWEKVVTRDPGGARRFKELSKALGKLLPIPSIVIEGKLVFETTPGVEVLRSCIDKIIKNMSDPS